MTTFKLVPANAASGAPPISISLQVPAGWKANAADASTLAFDVPGLESGSRVSLAAIVVKGAPAQAMSKAIDLQDLSDGQRSDLSGGRVWAQKMDGDMLHARIFVPFTGGVAMGVARLHDPGKLPEIRAAFETMVVAQ